MTSWRHNRDVKIIIMTQNQIYFIWKNFASTKSSIFSIAPGPIHKIQLRDFDLTQPRDTVTSWRHGMTLKNLFSVSQLVDVIERRLFFVSMIFGLLNSKMLSVLYLHDDVTSWRHVMTSKTGCALSQLVKVLERLFFFVSIVFRLA